jgi:hypothetical protein
MKDRILSPKLRGDIIYIESDAQTNETISEYHEKNVVVDTHMDIIIARLYEDNPDYKVTKARIGTDVGSGTTVDPELPTTDTTADDQTVIYETTENVTIDYPSSRSITYNIFLNGETIMNMYPGEESISFNSLALVTTNNMAFSYRRFPERSITESTNINILWTLHYD